ncbi:hypothetical protein [Winogradskyella jejuensis]|uniref:Uncharacterized protein n=1 Tax=Winogradskyella jejuensis TaxID=1089305 RepID=A0A1M5U0T7_9FLAO|nr:hypothetical protein [Winogradskyella jejuensis]SHH56263.1 hypothetical protein SAMN05444148_2321 [Winogradskyella jejuensis]
MKNYFFFLIFMIVIKGYSQYSVLPIDQVENKEFVYDFIKKIYIDKKLPILNPRNSKASFRTRFKSIDILESAKALDEDFGEIENIELEKVLLSDDSNRKIFRYRVFRRYLDNQFERRVFLDKNDKIIGLTGKGYWSDDYYEGLENPKVVEIDTSLINFNLKKRNLEFAFSSYNECSVNEFIELTEENSSYRSLKKGWKKFLLKECDSIKQKNGKLLNLKYSSSLTDSVFRYVHRYKVNFEKLERPSEIRIYSTLKNRFMGIFVIDVWYDKFYELDRAISKSKNILGN